MALVKCGLEGCDVEFKSLYDGERYEKKYCSRRHTLMAAKRRWSMKRREAYSNSGGCSNCGKGREDVRWKRCRECRLKNREYRDNVKGNGEIYCIVNEISGRMYIGSTLRRIGKRFSQHISHLEHRSHSNFDLQKDWIKFGKESFAFSCLESMRSVVTRRELKEIERGYMACIPRDMLYNVML